MPWKLSIKKVLHALENGTDAMNVDLSPWNIKIIYEREREIKDS